MKTGAYVAWQWGSGVTEGRIKSVYFEPVTIVSKGKAIKRNGIADNPAIVIEHKSGNDVLKLLSEVQQTQ